MSSGTTRFDVGMTGLIGFSSGYYAMLDCDVLLMLGTDFPYRQFYPRGAGVASHKSICGPNRSAAVRRSISASSATSVRRSQALLPLLKEARPYTPRRSDQTLPQGPQGSRRPRGQQARPQTDPSAAGRQGDQRSGRSRRHLYLRRRPADGVGGALSGDERQTAADRIVLAWLDGQCDAARDRRAGGVSRVGR